MKKEYTKEYMIANCGCYAAYAAAAYAAYAAAYAADADVSKEKILKVLIKFYKNN